MFWKFWKRKKEKPVVGTAKRLEGASEEERVQWADNLAVIATDLVLQRKFRDARDVASEAIKLFQTVTGHEMTLAKCYGLLRKALYGLGTYLDSSKAYLEGINVAKETKPESLHLQCRFWIDCGFALIRFGDRQLARISWKNAAHLCRLLERKANESISRGGFNHLLVAKFNLEKEKVEDYVRRINELHEEIGSIMVRPSAQEIYEVGCRCMKEGNFWWAIETFTSLIELAPDDKRGWLGRADARLALSCFLAEDYRAKGGKQYWLDRDELLSPVTQALNPPEKQRWWKINERIMKLQYAAKLDYQKVLGLDPNNQRAIETLRDIGA